MTDDRCANPAYQLEVDEMILDYLIYSTTKALISEAKGSRPLQRKEGQDEQNTATVLAIFDCTCGPRYDAMSRTLNIRISFYPVFPPESRFISNAKTDAVWHQATRVDRAIYSTAEDHLAYLHLETPS